jgi:uncharacterized membrane protein YbhN (UPF0104 family)
MLELPRPVLLQALAFAALSHFVYSLMDLVGRRYTGHHMGKRQVMLVSFISYAFNLNLGSLVGGVAFRYRLYSRLELSNGTITRVLGFSMLTNWLGYLVVAGAVFCFWPLVLPGDWKIDNAGLRILGAVLLLVASAYLALCAFASGHVFRIHRHSFKVPSFRMALLQLAISCLNWSLIGGVIWVLLQGQVAYHAVLAVLLVAAVAGVITHVPAGLGVLEAVFIALLSDQVPQGRLLGVLLVYRGLYYLLPLGVATLAYFVAELRAKRWRARAAGH